MTAKESQKMLATADLKKLLLKFALPSIMAMLIGAVYNLADQIFIGQAIGYLGNAATNVEFPINIMSMALSLLCGIGTAAAFSLAIGKGEEEKAKQIIGNGISLVIVLGVSFSLIVSLFLDEILVICGATSNTLPYAHDYSRIIVLGLPFLMFSVSGGHIIRADKNPNYSMFATSIGAILNIIFDAIFIFGFKWGMKGAALATIISQFISCLFILRYYPNFKTVKLVWSSFKFKSNIVKRISALGFAPFINQICMMIVQIVLNVSMRHYGELSAYGSDIPLACVGVVMKINFIFIAIAIGIAQGAQPILGYNFGAKNYDRVKKTYLYCAISSIALGIIFFALFNFLPQQLISLFGDGKPEYFEFGTKLLQILLFFVFINGIQPLTSNFFVSIGHSIYGALLALTRQFFLLLPLILILPVMYGIEGLFYTAPIADFLTFILEMILMIVTFRKIDKKTKNNNLK